MAAKKANARKDVAKKAAARPADTEGHAAGAKKGVARKAAGAKKDAPNKR